MSAGLTAGLLAAFTVAAAAFALAPRPAPLDERVRDALSPPSSAGRAARSWVARLRQRLVTVDATLTADLAVTGMTVEQLLTRRLVFCVFGAMLPLLAWPAGLASLGVSAAMAPLAALLGAAGGWMLALRKLRDDAGERRRELTIALAAYLQLAATMVRSGTGEEQALRDAADAGGGWTFAALRSAIDRAQLTATPLWRALDELGEELGLVELRTLGTELRIATREGSSPARTLTSRAASLRNQELAIELGTAHRAEQRMAGPLVGLGLCVIGFILFPALAAIITS